MNFYLIAASTLGFITLVSSSGATALPRSTAITVQAPSIQLAAVEKPASYYYQVSYSGYHGSKKAFPNQIRAPGVRVFIFSPRMKAWAAYLPNGRLAGYGRASGGAGWCADIKRSCRTPRGAFKVHRKGSPGCRSTRYPRPRGGAPMPYCMFFSKYYAIHGSPYVPNYNASHGCVRVTPSAARWLSNHFIHIGTKVIVTHY